VPTLLAASPRLERLDDFVTPEAAARLVDHLERLALVHDETGHVAEVEPSLELASLEARIAAAVGLSSVVRSVRYRRYDPGDGHPLHADDYEIDDARLVATAMLVLEAPRAGGATELPFAKPFPVAAVPVARSLVHWRNLSPEGELLASAVHRGALVRDGVKRVLLMFFYLPLEGEGGFRAAEEARSSTPAGTIAAPPAGTQLTCVVDHGLPEETTRLLREACAARDVLYREVDARAFDYAPESRLPLGAMLFRPATSRAAQHVEELLAAPGVATFYASAEGPSFPCVSPYRVRERAGIPQPRGFPVASADRGLVASFVERLGGYPIVVKVPGGEGGVGVLRADGPVALMGLLDHLVRGQGIVPWISSYVPDAMHHRVVVVGERAVVSYENPIVANDFRSSPSGEASAYTAAVPAPLARLAVAAARAEKVYFAGVDVLVHPTGRAYVIEVNSPCYFPQATLAAGLDVAGPMVDFLVARAKELALPVRVGEAM